MFGQGGPLKERVVRGTIWLAVGNGSANILGFVKIAILGRLLVPNDFGLMGIAMITLRWLEYFTETGLNKALVQKQDDIRPYLDTAWTVQLARAALLALSLLLFGPLAARVFDTPDATPVIRTMALVFVLRGAVNPALAFLRKELDFRRLVWWNLSSALTGLAVAVVGAVLYRSVWALVWSILASELAGALVSYWVMPYRPRLRLSRERALELFEFGKWIFLLNIVGFFGLYLDSMSVGILLGATALGLYQMAQQFGITPTKQVALLISGMMFPAFSRLVGTVEKRRAFLDVLSLVAAIVAPIGLTLTFFSGPIVELVLGEKWVSIAPAVSLLVWAGVSTAIIDLSNAFFQASGKPALSVRITVIRHLLTALLLVPLISAQGITGAAVAVVVGGVTGLLVSIYYAQRLIQFSGRQLLRASGGAARSGLPFLVVGLARPYLGSLQLPAVLAAVSLSLALLLPLLRTQLAFTTDGGSITGPESIERAAATR